MPLSPNDIDGTGAVAGDGTCRTGAEASRASAGVGGVDVATGCVGVSGAGAADMLTSSSRASSQAGSSNLEETTGPAVCSRSLNASPKREPEVATADSWEG